MNHHRVIFEVDSDGNWLVRAPDIKGCHSYGRSLSEARKNIREALELFTEDRDSVYLIENQRLPRPVRSAVSACRRARREAETASDTAFEATATAARFLSKETGLGIRDIGELLGVSYQRVAQLLSDDAA